MSRWTSCSRGSLWDILEDFFPERTHPVFGNQPSDWCVFKGLVVQLIELKEMGGLPVNRMGLWCLPLANFLKSLLLARDFVQDLILVLCLWHTCETFGVWLNWLLWNLWASAEIRKASWLGLCIFCLKPDVGTSWNIGYRMIITGNAFGTIWNPDVGMLLPEEFVLWKLLINHLFFGNLIPVACAMCWNPSLWEASVRGLDSFQPGLPFVLSSLLSNLVLSLETVSWETCMTLFWGAWCLRNLRSTCRLVGTFWKPDFGPLYNPTSVL